MTTPYKDALNATAKSIDVDPDGTFSHLHDDIDNDKEFQLMNTAIMNSDSDALDRMIDDIDGHQLDAIESELSDAFDMMFKTL